MRHAVQTARQADIRDIRKLLASQPLHAAVMQAIICKDPESAYIASREMFGQVWESIPKNHNSVIDAQQLDGFQSIATQ